MVICLIFLCVLFLRKRHVVQSVDVDCDVDTLECSATLGSDCVLITSDVLMRIQILSSETNGGSLCSSIYTIICLLSIGVRKRQVAILARSPREMSLTDRFLPRNILSRVRASVRPRIFLYAKNTQIRAARMLFISNRSAAS